MTREENKTDEPMFVIYDWMYGLGLPNINTILVYALIYAKTKNGTEYVQSLTDICESLNITKSTAVRCISELEHRNFITKRKSAGGSNAYCYCQSVLDELGIK